MRVGSFREVKNIGSSFNALKFNKDLFCDPANITLD